MSRIRAGLLEQNTVDLMNDLGVGERLNREGITHHGIYLNFYGKRIRVPFNTATDRCITIYGQGEVLKDMITSWELKDEPLYFEAEAAGVDDIESDKPVIRYTYEGEDRTLECDYVAGCDGYHGISRKSMPDNSYNVLTNEYPFGWLGILAEVAPSTDELIYAYHPNGFALHSYRSPILSRLYLQVDANDDINNWPDDRIWKELQLRLSTEGWQLKRGPIVEKGITPMRSFMIDKMQHGRLFIAGDAAHIVPPTGGKGLNLAVADVKILADGLAEELKEGKSETLDNYTGKALGRVWRAQEFSNFMTTLLHKMHDEGSFENTLQRAQFEYIVNSDIAKAYIAENYVGLKEI